MLEDNIAELLLLNGNIIYANGYADESRQRVKNVYEVIRVINGVPLFFDDHYDRLRMSFDFLGIELNISRRDLETQLKKVVLENGLPDCNVKIALFGLPEVQNVLLYISKSYYPGIEEITNGVHTGLLRLERPNPNLKLEDMDYKAAVNKKMQESGVFEVLLVNESNKITEGSKSNIFFVKGRKVFTAPDENVLKGITRKHVIEVCRKTGFELVETLIDVDSLPEMEGGFISGTSIKVLPVSSVEGQTFDSSGHPAVNSIRMHFDSLIEEHISRRNKNS